MLVDANVIHESEFPFSWKVPFLLLTLRDCCDPLLINLGVPHSIATNHDKRIEISEHFIRDLVLIRSDSQFHEDLHRLIQVTYNVISSNFGDNDSLILLKWMRYLFTNYIFTNSLHHWSFVFSKYYFHKKNLSTNDDIIQTGPMGAEFQEVLRFIYDAKSEEVFDYNLASCINNYKKNNHHDFHIEDNEIYWNDINVSEIAVETYRLIRISEAWCGMMRTFSDLELKNILEWGREVAKEMGFEDVLNSVIIPNFLMC